MAALQEQVSALDTIFLSSVATDPADTLPDSDVSAIRAYLVLGHACIEETIESTFLEHFDRLASYVVRESMPAAAASFLFAIGEHLPERRLAMAPYATRTLPGLVKAYADVYRAIVTGNHGVTPENIRSLSKPLGIDWSALDLALQIELADLATLGAKRGLASHTSPFGPRGPATKTEVTVADARTYVESGARAAEALRDYLYRAVWRCG